MYAVMGVTGKVGGAVAARLLEFGHGVRAVMRDPAKAGTWTSKGCEVAIADTNDASALTAAFRKVEGVFVLLPPIFDPQPGFPESEANIAAIRASLEAAWPAKIVCLSTIGADAARPNLLNQLGLLEEALESLSAPVTYLRAAWFIDNAALDVASARDTGEIQSFLQPADKQFPMVASRDVGSVAADLLLDTWRGQRVIELQGPALVTPNQIARAFGTALKRQVNARPVERKDWESLFRSYGMQNPTPRMQMLDGFNEGWITFADGGRHARRGSTTVDEVIASLVSNS